MSYEAWMLNAMEENGYTDTEKVNGKQPVPIRNTQKALKFL